MYPSGDGAGFVGVRLFDDVPGRVQVLCPLVAADQGLRPDVEDDTGQVSEFF